MGHRFWTQEEEEILVRMLAEDVSPEEISLCVDHPVASVQTRMHYLRQKMKIQPSSSGGYIVRPKLGILIHYTMLEKIKWFRFD